jgi:hypothetical protein
LWWSKCGALTGFDSICNKEELAEQWKKSVIAHIYKKNDKTGCGNYRGILLLSATYKTVSNIRLSKLTPYVDEIIGDRQCGFRRNRSTIIKIFCVRQIMEQNWEHSGTVHQLLTGFRKAHVSVRREVLYNILIEFHIAVKLIRLIKMYLNETYRKVSIGKKSSEHFEFRMV